MYLRAIENIQEKTNRAPLKNVSDPESKKSYLIWDENSSHFWVIERLQQHKTISTTLKVPWYLKNRQRFISLD